MPDPFGRAMTLTLNGQTGIIRTERGLTIGGTPITYTGERCEFKDYRVANPRTYHSLL